MRTFILLICVFWICINTLKEIIKVFIIHFGLPCVFPVFPCVLPCVFPGRRALLFPKPIALYCFTFGPSEDFTTLYPSLNRTPRWKQFVYTRRNSEMSRFIIKSWFWDSWSFIICASYMLICIKYYVTCNIQYVSYTVKSLDAKNIFAFENLLEMNLMRTP